MRYTESGDGRSDVGASVDHPLDRAVGVPSGMVTFLFTDIEGSTGWWESAPEEMRAALARHDSILRSAIAEQGGYVRPRLDDLRTRCALSRARVGLSPIALEVAMRTTRQLSITLPNDMADGLRERVRSGEYASESEVIREGLRALFARDQAVEAWLRDEVAAAYDAVVADPSRAVSAQAVRARLAGEQAGDG